MKKFFAMAVMALTVAFMASCAGSGSSSRYTAGGEGPKVDTENATINGKHYDDTVNKCWKMTVTQSYIVTVNVDEYIWGTEYLCVLTGEELMWTYAQTGIRASYKYAEAPSFKDSDACLANNTDEE